MKNALLSLAIFVAALFLYQSNGDTYIYTYDSAPNSLFVFNALENHRLDFDNFRGSYFFALGAGYAFVPGKDGRLTSLFPIGPAIVSAPLYLAFDAQLHAQHLPLDITSIDFERVRLHYEKLAANVLAALAAVLLFLCARRLSGLGPALAVTLFFAAGTEMWTVGSQALWQHGPVNLVLLGMIAALLAAIAAHPSRRTLWWLLLAGLCAGFLPVVRPTALVFLVAGGAFAALEFRRGALAFAGGALVGLLPGILWNEFAFGALTGGYVQNEHNYVFGPAQFAGAVAGELVSPAKGLFVFTPLFVFSLVGLWRVMHLRTPQARLLLLLSAAAAALVLNYGFYVQWWGGTCFGERFLTDVAAVGALLVLYAIPSAWPARIAFDLLLAASIAIQFVGANGEEFGKWSALPVSVDVQPGRLWSLADSPIQRDAEVTLHRLRNGAGP